MEKKLKEKVIKELSAICGERFVRGGDVTRWTYAIEDFGGTFFYPLSDKYEAPDVVVIPHTTEEVSQVVKVANKHKVPIIARGGGHDMTGAATPLKGKGGIIIDTTSMNKVLGFQEGMNAVKFQPGIRWGDIEHQLAEKGLTLGVLGPHGLHGGTLGAGIAHNCFSIAAPKYGWPTENVLTLQVVLPNGDVIETGSLANTSITDWYFRYCNGPDLAGIFMGSAGAFGIITEITMKTYPKPSLSSTFAYTFTDMDNYLQFVHELGWHQYVTELWGMAFVGLHDGLKNLLRPLIGESDIIGLTVEGHDEGIFAAQKKAIDKLAKRLGGRMVPIEGVMHVLGGSVIDKTEFAGGGLYGGVMGPNDNCTCSITPVLNWKRVVSSGIEVIKDNEDALSGSLGMIDADHFFIFPLILGAGNCAQSVVSTPVDYGCGNNDTNIQRAKELYGDMWECYLDHHVSPYRIGKENSYAVKRWKPEYMTFVKLLKKAIDPNNIMNPGVLELGLDDQEGGK